MYEILEKGSFKKKKVNHTRPKMNSQAIILKKPDCPVVQRAGGTVELRETDFEVIEDEALRKGSTRPRRIRFLRNITDEDGHILFAEGTEWVMKSGVSPTQIKTEVLTNKLYEAALVPVKPAYLARIGSQYVQLTRYIENFKSPEESELASSMDFIRYAGVDMVFANWDLFKTDNWLKESGRMIRIDNGGALDMRAQGTIRESWTEGQPEEFRSMVKGPYRGLEAHAIAESIRRLYDVLTPDRIDRAMEESEYGAEDPTGQKRRRMKAVLLSRLWHAMLWANMQFPSDSREEIPSPMPVLASDEERTEEEIVPDTMEAGTVLDTMEALRGFGFTIPDFVNTPLLFRIFYRWLVLPKRLLIQSIENENEWEALMIIAGQLEELPDYQEFLPEILKKTDPRARLPMVGPEEIYESDDHGGSRPNPFARRMPEILYRMRGGRLIRRMSEEEKNAFEQALGERDITRVVELLFPTQNPGKRGEIVWSVNRPYVFDRERGGRVDTSPPYAWILEIYISERMLRFISDYAFFENSVPKSSAFLGNPALKREGGSGGNSDSSGIPNFLVKREGFEHFWRTVERYHFEKAATYIGNFLNGSVPRESKADKIERLKEQGKGKRAEREQKKREQEQRQEQSQEQREQEQEWKELLELLMEESLDESPDESLDDTSPVEKESGTRRSDPPAWCSIRVQVRQPPENIFTVQQVLMIVRDNPNYYRFHNFWDAYDHFRFEHPNQRFFLSPLQVINYLERENPARLYILDDQEWDIYDKFRRTNAEFVYEIPDSEDEESDEYSKKEHESSSSSGSHI